MSLASTWHIAAVVIVMCARHRGTGVAGASLWSLGTPSTMEETDTVREAQSGALRLREGVSERLGDS